MIFRVIFNYIFRVKVEGIENFKNVSGNALIIANHNSFLDAFFFGLIFPKIFILLYIL